MYEFPNKTRYCYPKDYGIGKCIEHDKTLPPDCAYVDGKRSIHAPDWCDNLWCYVDPDNCLGVDAPLLSAYFPKSKTYYSYHTCGNENVFARHQQAAKKTAPELITVVETYSVDLRKDAEETYAMTTNKESVEKCDQWHSSCPCQTCLVSPEWTRQSTSSLSLDFSRTTLTISTKLDIKSLAVSRAQCMTQIIASKYKTIRRQEYNDKNRIAYLYYGDQGTGAIIMWPAMEWCTASYDARLRPWYATAATGPKDLIILLDASGSMSTSNLWDPAVVAAKAVLLTLTDKDWATIVLYSSQARVFDDLETLHPMTPGNQEAMAAYLDGNVANGGTNFRKGFELVSSVFKKSNQADKTSGCEIRTVLFLTDGKDESEFVPSEIATLGLKGTSIMTYSFGEDADERLPKAIACQNEGIWYPVSKDAPVANIMAKYYQLFAAGIYSEQVRWTEYIDAVSGTPLLAGCLPVYDKSGSYAKLVGVSCMDINVIVSLDTLRQKPLYKQMREEMDIETKRCARVEYGATTLQQLRLEVSDRSLCSSCDLTDAGCSSDSSSMVTSTQSPVTSAPGPASGAMAFTGSPTAVVLSFLAGLGVSV